MKRGHLTYARKVRPEMDGRPAWVRAVRLARDLSHRLSGATLAAPDARPVGDDIADFCHQARPLKAAGFPVQGASAMALAEAFVAAARGLDVAGDDARQGLCAGVLGAAAEALNEIIEDLRTEEHGRSWQSRYQD
jgi:hypothetical protein